MYSREIDGQNLTFASVGILYEDTFVLFDEETESLWYHLEGDIAMTAISGEYVGMRSAELPSGYDLERVEGAAPRIRVARSGELARSFSRGQRTGWRPDPPAPGRIRASRRFSSPVNDRMDSSAPKALTLPADSPAGRQPGRTGSTRGRAEGILRSRGSFEQGRKVYVRVSRFT